MSIPSALGDRTAAWRLPEDQSFALLQQIFEISSAGIAVINPGSAVVAANPAFTAIVGYSADELVGLPISRLIHPDDWSSEAKDLDHAAHGEPAAPPAERRLVRKDGSVVTANISATAVHDRDHSVNALVLMVEDLTRSREAETRRVETERALGVLFESVVDAVFVADADTGVIVDANKTAAALLRCPADRIKGRPLWLLHPEDEDDQSKELFFQYTRNPGTRFSDVWVERPDGSLLIVEVRSSGVLTLGRRRVVTVFFRDLSHFREVEEALRRSERRYRDMVETTSEGFLQIDPAGVIVEANEALCHMLGLSRAEVIGRRPDEFVHPAYVEVLENQIATRTKTRHRSYELVLKRMDGLEKFTRVHASSVFDEQGRFALSFALLTDLTELKRREGALAKSEARYRAIVETAVDAIITIDSRGKVLSINPAGEKLLGFSAEELTGSPISLIIPGPEAGEHQSHLDRYLETRRKQVIGIGREVQVKRRDGSIFPARLSVSEIAMPDFQIFVGVIHDITEVKRAEQALVEAKEASDLANRAKTAFLSNMTHELRTPLNGILGFAEIIASQMLGPVGNPEYRNYATEIKRSGEHLLANINDILEMATIEAGQIDLNVDLIDLRDVVVACLRLVAKRAERAKLQIHADIGSELPPIEADPGALKQVLLHLLSNAIKFTPEGGRVGVSARIDHAGDLIIEVFDTGIGIPTSRLENVLQPFVQADSTLARRFEGIGLGLSISKSLVEMHGGKLQIRSEENAGTTVTIRLPKERMLADW